MSTEQVCQGGDTLIFACSGAADVGAISDLAARKLTRDGIGKMFCLAGVGGGVQAVMDKTKSAARVLAIDGCALDCVKSTLEKAGLSSGVHLRVTDMNMAKGRSPANEARIEAVVTQARALLESGVAMS